MSLFRVRDFWNFDLDQLLSHYSIANSDEFDSSISKETGNVSFIVSLGRFDSIGNYDVFVCANLRGFLCIIQVPLEQQEKYTNNNTNNQDIVGDVGDDDDDDNNNKECLNDKDYSRRQLLLAKQFDYPIVDIKSGYFTSAIKQSIAVLSFDKLIIYQVNKHQVDLLTSSNDVFDQSLFSHELEEQRSFDLISVEMAFNLVVVNCHSESNLISRSIGTNDNNAEFIIPKSSIKQAAKKNNHQQWLQLPQRDSLIVQYTNQFIFTLIENKKLIAHFKINIDSMVRDLAKFNQNIDDNKNEEQNSRPLSESHNRLNNLAQYVSSMPLCYLHDARGSYIIISFSDYKIYSLQLVKLLTEAKASVMKRITKNLLIDNIQPAKGNVSPNKQGQHKLELYVIVDLDLMSDWSNELAYMPLKMSGISRHTDNSMTFTSQLLIMSRYNLDLFSYSGEHLWSFRFESPLIALDSYILENNNQPTKTKSSKETVKVYDKMFTMICTDNVGGGRSSLIILDEDRIVWSALLNYKPSKIFRANLSKLKGIITTMDNNQLNATYLGTNQKDSSELKSDEQEKNLQGDENQFTTLPLNLLDEPLFDEDKDEKEKEKESTINENLIKTQQIEIDIRLESSNQWPNVKVDCCINILPDSNLTNVLQDMSLILEYDEIIEFQLNESSMFHDILLSDGVKQIHIGHLWPDRRDPIKILGSFSMQTCDKIDSGTANSNSKIVIDKNLLPNSLEVKLYLRYNDILLGTSLIQEESFILPLNLLVKLAHIDYSSGYNQNLEDVLGNLIEYKQQQDHDSNISHLEDEQYFMCDLLIKTKHDNFIQFIDEFLESDLICRGYNRESKEYKKQSALGIEQRKQSTLENINLMAQSLDCRLKFKNIKRTSLNQTNESGLKINERQSSEEHPTAVMVSLALKLRTGSSNILNNLTNQTVDLGQLEEEANHLTESLVWIHLCDLTCNTLSESTISKQLIEQHLKSWKCFDDDYRNINHGKGNNFSFNSCPVLISIESENPLTVLFIQKHLTNIIKKQLADTGSDYKSFIKPLTEKLIDIIEINYNDIFTFKVDHFITINEKFYLKLIELFKLYEKCLINKYKKLKEELNMEYCKFHLTTMTSLSMSKKLSDLPEDMAEYYSSLISLTNQYQFKLNKLLTELDKLKRLNYEYKKLSISEEIMLMFINDNDLYSSIPSRENNTNLVD